MKELSEKRKRILKRVLFGLSCWGWYFVVAFVAAATVPNKVTLIAIKILIAPWNLLFGQNISEMEIAGLALLFPPFVALVAALPCFILYRIYRSWRYKEKTTMLRFIRGYVLAQGVWFAMAYLANTVFFLPL